MKDIETAIENYKSTFGLSEANTPFILIAEILIIIEKDLDNIASKMWE